MDDNDEKDDPQDDPDYDPNNDSGNDDSDDDDGDEGNVTKAEHDNDKTPGVDVEILGVDDSDDVEETLGMDGETPEVGETEAQEAKSDKDAENEQKKDNKETVTHASGSTSL